MLSSHQALWQELQHYLEKTKSTGCGYIDYACLYQAIRTQKPTNVLECGTGVSTLIIAHALMENERETGIKGQVTSMEEHDEWLQMSMSLLPAQYRQYVEFRLSGIVEDKYSLFRGIRYESIPQKEYDFVFVDGPKYRAPSDGMATFDFDFIYILSRSDKPVSGLVDKRLSTVFVLQQLLGPEKVTYSVIKGLGFVSPCSKADLGNIAMSISSRNFSGSFRLFGNSVLSITNNTNSKEIS